jgi:GNAT superfamily N-acetyltransferase
MNGETGRRADALSVAVRPMCRADATKVAQLTGELGYPATAAAVVARFERIEARSDARVFVAHTDDGSVVGWLHVYGSYLLESDPHAEIGGLVVADGSRGRRVGAALMAAAEAWAAEHGYEAIRVRSRIARIEAHGFYEHLGYTRIKTQHSFRKALAPQP